MCKVSVVIPVYNVEDCIARCAESLFRQTLDDMQFIFVDDASPDGSVARLEETLERFPRRKSQTVILHHTENRGLPSARATGLALVEAPYVAHCDSDDRVEPEMYARLYECAVKNGSDLVMCGRIVHRPDGREYASFDRSGPGSSLIDDFLYGRIGPHVWRLLTKTELFRRVRFPKENEFEDAVQTAQLLTFAKRVSFLDETLYHYILRSSSVSMACRLETIDEKIRQCKANYSMMHDFVMEHHPQVKEKDFIFYKTLLRFRYLPQIGRPGIRKKYAQTFPEINFSLLFNRKVSLRYRLSHLLILLGLYPAAKAARQLIR